MRDQPAKGEKTLAYQFQDLVFGLERSALRTPPSKTGFLTKIDENSH
jgi:hypothetical protein